MIRVIKGHTRSLEHDSYRDGFRLRVKDKRQTGNCQPA